MLRVCRWWLFGDMVSLLIGLLYASLQLPLDNHENKNSPNVCLSQIRENIFPQKFLLIQYLMMLAVIILLFFLMWWSQLTEINLFSLHGKTNLISHIQLKYTYPPLCQKCLSWSSCWLGLWQLSSWSSLLPWQRLHGHSLASDCNEKKLKKKKMQDFSYDGISCKKQAWEHFFMKKAGKVRKIVKNAKKRGWK